MDNFKSIRYSVNIKDKGTLGAQTLKRDQKLYLRYSFVWWSDLYMNRETMP